MTKYPKSAARRTSVFSMPVAVTGKSLLTKKAVDSALSALLGENSGGIDSYLG